jgi:hypothetical protein
MKTIISGLLAGIFCLFFSEKTFAASVTCNFLSGTTYSKSGEWVGASDDFIAIMQLFGPEGLKLKLEDNLVENLDKRKIFLAGKTRHGNVYLLGSDMGVRGKAIKVDDNKIKIYDGICQVGFG